MNTELTVTLEDVYRKCEGQFVNREKQREVFLSYVEKKIRAGYLLSLQTRKDYEYALSRRTWQSRWPEMR